MKPGVTEELHITSLVVHCTPARAEGVSEAIASIPGTRVHAVSASFKIVVTLEASTTAEMMSRISGIQCADGVLSATLVYQYIDALETMNEEVPDAQT